MDNRDNELDELLKPLRGIQANEEQKTRWTSFLMNSQKKSFAWQMAQLAIAACFGFIVAMTIFSPTKTSFQLIAHDESTIEYIDIHNP